MAKRRRPRAASALPSATSVGTSATGDALLQGIRDNPGDDDLRLVFADWLEENGDPDRADFIRTQTELSRLPSGDPRQRALREREKGLRRRYGGLWQGAFFEVPGVRCEFSRGLLALSMKGDDLLD